MQDPLDALENRIGEIRRAIRRALASRDQEQLRALRADLRRAERSWDELVAPALPAGEDLPGPASLLPAREQVHQSLTLLGVPAAPKLIATVHSAFFSGQLAASALASLRRDEERSYRLAPGARPYYLCPALTADLLSPARALVCVSTWPAEQRVIGPLSPRADFLTAAARVARTAEALGDAGAEAAQLLRRFALNIPGAGPARPGDPVSPAAMAAAAEAELAVHAGRDRDDRLQAARRARRQLGEAEQLFGVRLKAVRGTARPASQ